MPFPFDATLKEIVQQHAADFAPVLGLPVDLPAKVLNVDLSTISAATDVALGYGDPLQVIVDLNFQSGSDSQVDGRIHLYNAAFYHRFHVPVRSILIRLRPEADHSRLTGELRYQSGGSRVEFAYEVIRIWKQPVELFLEGGVGLLPVAPLCRLPEGLSFEEGMTTVLRESYRRMRATLPHEEAAKLMTATAILAGLRLSRDMAARVFRGVGTMEESTVYQLIIERGELKEVIKLLLRLGRKRFGPPDTDTETALKAITDLERLERMADAVLTASSWQELLATP